MLGMDHSYVIRQANLFPLIRIDNFFNQIKLQISGVPIKSLVGQIESHELLNHDLNQTAIIWICPALPTDTDKETVQSSQTEHC